MHLFLFFFAQSLFHDVNDALHRRLGIPQHAAMSDGQYGGLESQQFARALQGEPFMPGGQRRQGKEYLECPRYGYAAQGLEGITGDYGAIPGIEKGEMARGVSWRGNRFEGADTVSFVQQEFRLRCADG